MRTIDDIYGLTSLPPTLPFMPPPSMQLQYPMLPPMTYHPILSAMGRLPMFPPVPPPVFSPPPLPPPPAVPPLLHAPPLPPPPPPPPPPQLPRLPQAMFLPGPAPAPTSVGSALASVQSVVADLSGTLQNLSTTLGNFAIPPPTGRLPVSPIGTGFGMAATTAAQTSELASARELLARSSAEVGELLSTRSLAGARRAGEIVGSIAGSLALRNIPILGWLAGGELGGALGRMLVDNPLTRTLFGAGSERYGDVMRGAAAMQLGAFGNVFFSRGPTTGIAFEQAEEISRRLRRQAMDWRFRTRAGYEDESRYFQEMTQLFSTAGQAGLFLGAGNIEQLMERFRKILRFSGKLAEVMNDPDIKNNIQHLGQLAMMGMSLDQALSVTTQVGRFARPLGMRAADVFSGIGAFGMQAWGQAGLAPGFGAAQGAFAQMMATFGMGALRPTQLQLLGGREGFAQQLTQMTAQFAAGAPGGLLMMAGITGAGGLQATPGAMFANLQRARGISHLAGIGAQNVFTTARQLVASGEAENITDALMLIQTRQREMRSELLQDPVVLARGVFETARGIRRQLPQFSPRMALQLAVGGNPQLAEALTQIAQNRDFQERLMNLGRDEAQRAWDAQMQGLRESSAAFERSMEYRTPILGWFRRTGRDVTRYFAERQMRLGTAEVTREALLAGRIGAAATPAARRGATYHGISGGWYAVRRGAETPEDIAGRILQESPAFLRSLGITTPDLALFLNTPTQLYPLVGRELELPSAEVTTQLAATQRDILEEGLRVQARSLVDIARDLPTEEAVNTAAIKKANETALKNFEDPNFSQKFTTDSSQYILKVQEIARRFRAHTAEYATLDVYTQHRIIGDVLGYKGRDLGLDVLTGKAKDPNFVDAINKVARNALLFTDQNTRAAVSTSRGALMNSLVTGQQALERDRAQKIFETTKKEVIRSAQFYYVRPSEFGPDVERYLETPASKALERSLTPAGLEEAFQYVYGGRKIGIEAVYQAQIETGEGVSPGLQALILGYEPLRRKLATTGMLTSAEISKELGNIQKAELGKMLALLPQVSVGQETVQPESELMTFIEDIKKFRSKKEAGVGAGAEEASTKLYQAAIHLERAAQALAESK